MIDILSENLQTLDEARRLLPGRRPGTSMSRPTVYRAASHGICGVRLETVSCGGRLLTSKQAVRRWVEKLTEAKRGRPADPSADQTSPRTEGEALRAGLAARAKLDQMMPAARKRKAAPTVQATA